MAVISAIIDVALIAFGLIDMVSIVREILGWRTVGIIHFGPLRPVHEWIR